jgi:Transport protein particle (TRAPP) component
MASMTSSAGELRIQLSFRDKLNHALSLNTLGYRIGMRVFELMIWRTESSSKAPKREIRFLPALMLIHTQVWKAVFGKPADAIEKSVENADECTSDMGAMFPQVSNVPDRHDH